ncbi:unnamed protein product [Closterium sp. Naga37s-1]|nr:unnamed protein product [Closterium sp. Naga37s-1]
MKAFNQAFNQPGGAFRVLLVTFAIVHFVRIFLIPTVAWLIGSEEFADTERVVRIIGFRPSGPCSLPRPVSNCTVNERIHIVLVSAQWDREPFTRDETEVILKSILMSTQCRLFFHFMVSGEAEEWGISDMMEQLGAVPFDAVGPVSPNLVRHDIDALVDQISYDPNHDDKVRAPVPPCVTLAPCLAGREPRIQWRTILQWATPSTPSPSAGFAIRQVRRLQPHVTATPHVAFHARTVPCTTTNPADTCMRASILPLPSPSSFRAAGWQAELLGINITHHSGEAGFAKLFLPEILWNVRRAIYLDVDMVAAEDLGALWGYFREMDADPDLLLFMGDNHPTAYGPRSRYPFCSCQLIMDLDRLRRHNLTRVRPPAPALPVRPCTPLPAPCTPHPPLHSPPAPCTPHPPLHSPPAPALLCPPLHSSARPCTPLPTPALLCSPLHSSAYPFTPLPTPAPLRPCTPPPTMAILAASRLYAVGVDAWLVMEAFGEQKAMEVWGFRPGDQWVFTMMCMNNPDKCRTLPKIWNVSGCSKPRFLGLNARDKDQPACHMSHVSLSPPVWCVVCMGGEAERDVLANGAFQLHRTRVSARASTRHLPPIPTTFPPLPDPALPPYEQFVLPNGLRVFLLEDHELGLVGGQLLVKGGAQYEAPDKVGVAGMMAAVQRSGGTQQYPEEQLDDTLEAMAASIETSAGTSSLSASFRCLQEDAPTLLPLLRDVVLAPLLPASKLAFSRTQLLGSIARRNDDPGRVASRELQRLLYSPASPRGRYPLAADVARISLADLRAFHAASYSDPSQAVLGVWGDFDARSMRDLLEDTFLAWPAAPASPARRTSKGRPVPYWGPEEGVAASAAGVYVVDRPGLTQSIVRVGELGITISDQDVFALDVLNAILNGFGGRLFDQVRSREGLAYSVSGSWSPGVDHRGAFVGGGETRAEAVGQFVTAVQRVLGEATLLPPSPGELQEAKDRVLNSFVFNFADRYLSMHTHLSHMSRHSKLFHCLCALQPHSCKPLLPMPVCTGSGAQLSRIMTYSLFGIDQDFIFEFKRRVEALSPDAVLAAAQRRLHPLEQPIVVVADAAAVMPQLSALGLPVTLIDPV